MDNHAANQSVIILTGMHRSGTSLTASLLQSAGVFVGDRLMGAANGNYKGHFEDWDFVEFHQNVLQSQGISIAGWTEQSRIEVQQQYLAQAQNLIAARSNQAIWGWKDPRTTLFVDFWLKLIPDAKYIFLYRSPWEVVDSLFRRRDAIFGTNPNFAVNQWCHYNQAVLDFYQRYREQCLLLDISGVIQDSHGFIDLIKQKLKIELKVPESLYEPALFNADSNTDYRQALITKFFPQALDLYHQLQQQADAHYPNPIEQQAIEPTCTAWILQDWHNMQRTTKEKRETEQELAQAKTELAQANTELAQANTELAQANTELAQANTELTQANTELTQTQHQLRRLEAKSRKELEISQMATAKLQRLVAAMESSKFWQLRQNWFALKTKLNLKNSNLIYQEYLASTGQNFAGSHFAEVTSLDKSLRKLKDNFPQKAALKKVAGLITGLSYPSVIDIKASPQSQDSQYQKWLKKNYPKPNQLSKIAQTIAKLPYQPLISIIVPVYNPPERFLREAIESVLNQVYTNWELCLADDCSTESYVKSILKEYEEKDQRIKVTFRSQNGHISRTSNSALELATGEYIALLDHDDLLAPHALAEVVKLLNQHPEADFIYSDEDKVDEKNLHRDPFFKPDWCPDSFLSKMYTCHLGVYRESLITKINGFRIGFEGSQDYDLVLRVTEQTNQIFHIPTILYHWRIHAESAASGSAAKPYAYEAGKKALSEALIRRKEPGTIIPLPGYPGFYTARYEIREKQLVSIIIPTRDLAQTLNICLKSVFTKTSYPNYEVIVIDNGSQEAETFECFSDWKNREPDRFKVHTLDIPFNYSMINNYAVTQSQGHYLLFLNNDTEVINSDWLELMVEQAQRTSVGAVGGLLLYPNQTIQHAGVILGLGGIAGHGHKSSIASQPGYFGQVITVNNYSAVTGACLMCRREVFDEVRGFEEELAIAYNDVDLCLKMMACGYRNVYLPHVRLYHYESKSRVSDNTPVKQQRFIQEVNYMKQKWQELCDRDPCYNPNLTLNLEDYSLNV